MYYRCFSAAASEFSSFLWSKIVSYVLAQARGIIFSQNNYGVAAEATKKLSCLVEAVWLQVSSINRGKFVVGRFTGTVCLPFHYLHCFVCFCGDFSSLVGVQACLLQVTFSCRQASYLTS